MKFLFSPFILFVSITLYAQNQFEPNNSCNTAYPINYNLDYEGAIQEAFDVDYYEITIPTEGVIKIQITGISVDHQIAARLYDEDCINVVEADNSELGNILVMYEKICYPGVYKLELKDSGTQGAGQWSLDLYTLTVTLDTSDVYETNNCNDECGDAAEIELGEAVQGAIADEYDEDFFKFEVPTEGVIKVEITGISDDYEMFAFLYSDINCVNEIEQEYEPSENFLVMYEKTCSPGTHILRLKDGGGSVTNDWSPQLYTLTVTLDTSDIYECNDDENEAYLIQPCNDTIYAAINEFGDQDYFQFEAPANVLINITVTNIPDAIDMMLDLSGPANGNDSANNGSDVSVSVESPEEGLYTLWLHDSQDNDFDPGLYQLVIEVLPQISFESMIADQCIDGDSIQLVGGQPEGGYYSGPGVNEASGFFHPGVAGVNSHEITYHYTNPLTGCSNTVSAIIEVHDLPVVSFDLVNDTVLITQAPFTLLGSPSGGIFSGSGVSGEIFNPMNAVLGDNLITYTYVDEFGCTNSVSQTITVIQTTGLSSVFSTEGIQVLPNPFSNNLKIAFDAIPVADVKVLLYQANGQLCFQKCYLREQQVEIATDHLSKGLYILMVQSDDWIVTRRLVKY